MELPSSPSFSTTIKSELNQPINAESPTKTEAVDSPSWENVVNPIPAYDPTSSLSTYPFSSPMQDSYSNITQANLFLGNSNIETTAIDLFANSIDSSPTQESEKEKDSKSEATTPPNFNWMHSVVHSPIFSNPNAIGYIPPTLTSVLLSCTKLPNRKDICGGNSKEIPLPIGTIYTPLANILPAPPCLRRPPTKCSYCGAYINRYCAVDFKVGAWVCCFCNCRNIDKNQYLSDSLSSFTPNINDTEEATDNKIIYPELVKMTVEYLVPSEYESSLVAVNNTFSNVSCDFCHLFLLDLSVSFSEFQGIKDSIMKAIRFLEDDLYISSSTPINPSSHSVGIGIITFSKVVTIYHLSSKGIAIGDVFSGNGSPSLEEIASIRRSISNYLQFLPASQSNNDLYSNIEIALDSISSSLPKEHSNAKHQKTNVSDINSCRSLGAAIEIAIQLLGGSINEQQTSAKAKNYFSPTVAGKITILLTGTPNWGPGAILQHKPPNKSSSSAIETDAQSIVNIEEALQYYKKLGHAASHHNISIDIFCLGLLHFHSLVLQNLVLYNGGAIIMQKEYFVQVKENVNKQEENKESIRIEATKEMIETMKERMNNICGKDAFVTIVNSSSSSICVSHIIGSALPVSSQDLPPNPANREVDKMTGNTVNKSSPSQFKDVNVASTKFRLGSVQGRLNLTILLEVLEDIVEDHVYIQFIVEFTNAFQQRVVTRAIPTTGNKATFMKSIDNNVSAVVIGKEAVLQARKLSLSIATSKSSNSSFNIFDTIALSVSDSTTISSSDFNSPIRSVLNFLDKTVHQLAVSFGERSSKSTERVARLVYRLPHELAPLPKMIYLLRRGPLLGPILQHPDDIDFLRCLFINADVETCHRIVQPKLLMLVTNLKPEESGGKEMEFYEVPLEDVSMQSDKILILDHHTDIFVWLGIEVVRGDPELLSRKKEFCKEYIQSSFLSTQSHRFPYPSEGSSMARWLQCRLIPSHKDSTEEQLESFPQLDELTKPQLSSLLSKFHRTDDLSFNQYYRSLFLS